MRARNACRTLAAAFGAAVLAACGSSDAPNLAPVTTQSFHVAPGDTGDGISNTLGQDRMHYVVEPAHDGRRNALIVFLGGTSSTPSDYTTLADHLGSLGYGVIDLRYPDGRAVGSLCNTNDVCFTNVRGETAFGANIAYEAGASTYSSLIVQVDAANSIIGRVVAVIDYLANLDDATDADYWDQFLIADAASPYIAKHFGPAYPNWSKIIISGHSQGGGDAAFIAMHLPADSPVKRVVMLSSPNDNVDGLSSASWISDASTTPLDRFWGLRAPDEGVYGSFTSANWAALGGTDHGGVGGDDGAEQDIGDGSGDPAGAHRLVLDSSGGALAEHNSTAVNDGNDRFPANRESAWDYLFDGGTSD
ncbi:BPSS1187 family protein [Solimonas marina]|uniref:Alpha/beta hydrolase family protein n=1 Tax=Solimonas marina TaxID=2714601 RepID=A0A970B605_9GAMM|nr:hypothetical protein [Solimonas marina]NKF22283.1 hypothetical protein [Solimonas marina]